MSYDASFEENKDSSVTQLASSVHATSGFHTTTVLAGVIAGVGLVIVIINLGVLFVCRRNLKKFLKSSSNACSSSSSSSSNTSSTTTSRRSKTLGTAKDDHLIIQEYLEAFNTLHNKRQEMANNNRTSSTSSSGGLDDSLLLNGPGHLLNAAGVSIEPTTMLRASQSAFRPFLGRNNDQMLLQTANCGNQYDKINHHNLLHLLTHHQSFAKPLDHCEMSSQDQYAHTYECLDTLEVPNRRFINGGATLINSTNKPYRTVFSPKMLTLENQHQQPAELVNNISSSSGGSAASSGHSSTHQFIKISNGDPKQFNNTNSLQHLIQLPINSQQLCSLVNGGELLLHNGSWSPDSAYYSSIPQQPNNNSYNQGQHEFKSHLV
jgi:hypothetical protein